MAQSQVALSEEQISKWAWLDTDNDGQVSANDIVKVIVARAAQAGIEIPEGHAETATQQVIDYFYSDVQRSSVAAIDFQNIGKYDDRAIKDTTPYYFNP